MFVFNCLGSITSSLVRLLRLQLSQTCDMERCCFLHSLTCSIPWVGRVGGGADSGRCGPPVKTDRESHTSVTLAGCHAILCDLLMKTKAPSSQRVEV